MQYTKRDMRAADMLGLILVGFGISALVVGVVQFTLVPNSTSTKDTTTESETTRKANIDKPAEKPAKASFASVPGLRAGLLGFVCLVLGIAVNLKVRQLQRSGRREPENDAKLNAT